MTDPEQVFEEDQLTVTLNDGFPKARYHYLIVPREDIDSVQELKPRDLQLLRHMDKRAKNLIARVREKDPDMEFRFGYHAVPSLRRLHMHVISQDFDSPRMRTRHHWNTFNTEYFIDSTKLITTLESSGRIEIEKSFYEEQLDLPMKCNQCQKRYDDMDRLKGHLALHVHRSN